MRSIPIRLRSRRLNIEMHITSIIILSSIGITRAPIRRPLSIVTRICDHDYDVGTAVGAAVVGVCAGCLEGVAGAAGLRAELAVFSFPRRRLGERGSCEGLRMDLTEGGGRDAGME